MTFKDLREDLSFADVTLACEDGQQIEAHKVILSVSSPFFMNILTRNKHAHPLIYMRGMTAQHLMSAVDFIYHGEVNIAQDDLNDFLAMAEELQLKGLTSELKQEKEQEVHSESIPAALAPNTQPQNSVIEEK
jgi:hypothetical protein